jgi:hypothetical protein
MSDRLAAPQHYEFENDPSKKHIKNYPINESFAALLSTSVHYKKKKLRKNKVVSPSKDDKSKKRGILKFSSCSSPIDITSVSLIEIEKRFPQKMKRIIRELVNEIKTLSPNNNNQVRFSFDELGLEIDLGIEKNVLQIQIYVEPLKPAEYLLDKDVISDLKHYFTLVFKHLVIDLEVYSK